MSLTNNFTSFTASASVTVNTVNGPPATYALPSPDSANTALTITNTSNTTAFVQIGNAPSGMQAGPTQKGSLVLNAGQVFLLTSSNQGTATYASVGLLNGCGGSVVFTRGTATNITAFNSHDDQVVV